MNGSLALIAHVCIGLLHVHVVIELPSHICTAGGTQQTLPLNPQSLTVSPPHGRRRSAPTLRSRRGRHKAAAKARRSAVKRALRFGMDQADGAALRFRSSCSACSRVSSRACACTPAEGHKLRLATAPHLSFTLSTSTARPML